MTIDQIKAWVEVVASALTACALVIGGIFGAYQYLEQAHDDKVKETLNFLDRYNRPPVAEARARQQEKWQDHADEENRTSGQAYNDFIIQTISKEKLEPSIAVSNDFYNALEICSRNNICEPNVALQLFQEGACSFFNRHHAFIAQQRLRTGDQSIGLGTEIFAKDSRGAETVSCFKRHTKWNDWISRHFPR
jgi:hypothetical protein